MDTSTTWYPTMSVSLSFLELILHPDRVSHRVVSFLDDPPVISYSDTEGSDLVSASSLGTVPNDDLLFLSGVDLYMRSLPHCQKTYLYHVHIHINGRTHSLSRSVMPRICKNKELEVALRPVKAELLKVCWGICGRI